ncbi:MAG: tetratricopeptide repeat protein [Fuerstiella sp.]
MSVRKSAGLKLAVALATVIISLIVVAAALNNSPNARLASLRDEVKQLIRATTHPRRVTHANTAIAIAETLKTEPDPLAATAELYILALSDLAEGTAPEREVPKESRVEQLATEDLLNAAQIFFNSRRFGPADQLIALALSRNDDLREQTLRLAVTIRFDIGRDVDTLAHCNELLTISPNDVPALRVISLVHRNHGRWENFAAATETLLEHCSPQDHETRINLVEAYVRLGRTADARREFDRVFADWPDIGQRAPTLYAKLLIQEGLDAKADSVLESYLKSSPNDTEALLLRGTYLIANKRLPEAITILRTAVELSPSDEQIHYQLGQAYARNGEKELANKSLAQHRLLLDKKVSIHEMEELAAKDPLNVTVRVELAHSYAELGLIELADFWTRAAIAAEGR